MSIGWQEIIALLIVTLVVFAAVYRRWKKGRSKKPGCTGCESGDSAPKEAPLRFYRRRR